MYQNINASEKLPRFINCIFWVIVIPFFAHFLLLTGKELSLLMEYHQIYDWIILLYSLIVLFTFSFALRKFIKYLSERKNFKSRPDNFGLPLLLFDFLTALFFLSLSIALCLYFISTKNKWDFISWELPFTGLIFCIFIGFYTIIVLNKQALINFNKGQQQTTGNTKLSVYYKGAFVLINLYDIAMIDQVAHINWLITFTGEEYILDQSLKEMCILLNPDQFFKINRNQIINKEMVKSFKPGTFGKLELRLKMGRMATVSKGRAKDFKRWLTAVKL